MSRFRCHELHNLLFVKLEKVVEIAKINEEDASDGPIKKLLESIQSFFKYGPNPASFCLFLSFTQ